MHSNERASRLLARLKSQLTIRLKLMESEKEASKLELERAQRERDRMATYLNRVERGNLNAKLVRLVHLGAHTMDAYCVHHVSTKKLWLAK